MSKPIIAGKKPLSTKSNPSIMTDDVFSNRLSIPAEIQKELEEQGLVGRWVSGVELARNQGYHSKGWVPYKRKKSDKIDTAEFLGGKDVDGYVKRGDAVLAVKSVEAVEKHKAVLAQRSRQQLGYGKQQAAELRNMIKSSGMEGSVSVGYDDEDFEE